MSDIGFLSLRKCVLHLMPFSLSALLQTIAMSQSVCGIVAVIVKRGICLLNRTLNSRRKEENSSPKEVQWTACLLPQYKAQSSRDPVLQEAWVRVAVMQWQ